MAKKYEFVYRVYNKQSDEYSKNYSTGTHIWTRRVDAAKRARRSDDLEIHKFKLVRVDDD